jgi:hypothetical protein
MKARKLLFVSLLLALILAACGGGDDDGGGDPVDVVKDMVNALEDLDLDKMQELVCEAQRADLVEALTGGAEEMEAAGITIDELLNAMKVTVENDKYEEKSKSGDEAVVHVSGSVKMEFKPDEFKALIKKMLEAEGTEIPDEMLDPMIDQMIAEEAQEDSIDSDVKLVKEEGEWLICDPEFDLFEE